LLKKLKFLYRKTLTNFMGIKRNMAKIYLDRLKRRHGYSGEKYGELIKKIIAENTNNISERISRVSKEKWELSLEKLQTTIKEKRKFIIPDISEVKPEKAFYIRKAAERGNLIKDTLRDRLTEKLRSTLSEFTPKTGEATFIKRRGVEAGKINTKLIKEFEGGIKETFLNYVKKDRKLGMPSNIHSIAVTEIRSTINQMKNKFNDELQKKNQDLTIIKIWRHNKSLSHEPRKGHLEMNGKAIPINQVFMVPLYKKIRDKNILITKTHMRYPHDETAPAEQVISCNCDIEYTARPKRNNF